MDLHTGAIAARYARKHAMYTSLWRAFSPPPQDWPLALCDYRSLTDDEGVPNFLFRVPALPDPAALPGTLPGDLDAAGAESAASVFAYPPGHRWYYFPFMDAAEAIVLKLHDTDHSVAWRAPHTSFRDDAAVSANPRQSIELRSVAYFY